MGKYIKEFSNHTEYEEFVDQIDFNLQTPNISLCNRQNEVHYSPYEKHDYSQDYLTFEIVKDGNLYYSQDGSSSGSHSAMSIQYSVDNGTTWSTLFSKTYSPINVTSGQKVLFKGNNQEYLIDNTNYFYFGGTAYFNLSGNIKSLISFNSTLSNYNFYRLFQNCKVINVENLILPFETLTPYCYKSMFSGCTSLKKTLKLPATTLAEGCYQDMFHDCSSLTTAPELPATQLENWCYGNMFFNSGLIITPQMHITKVASQACYGMFSGCYNLKNASNILLEAESLMSYCYDSMFQQCTSLKNAPELPATTLVSNCYRNMFNGCSSLNSIKAMFTTTPGSEYTSNWVKNVSSTGTFIKNSAAQWNVTGDNGIPSSWAVQTASS